MRNTILQFLAGKNAGLYITSGVFLIALAVTPVSAIFSIILFITTALLFSGVLKFKLVDSLSDVTPGSVFVVDGVKTHILAEGEKGTHYPVIWVGGGHGEGLVMFHLHEMIRTETRSILFDRVGAGWSDLSTLPITIESEVRHLKNLLETAGEQGPFVLAGHSFGGLFSLNFAHHYPDLVAGLVLMDPTPPVNVSILGNLSFGRLMQLAPWRALGFHFGLTRVGDPEIDDKTSDFYRCLSQHAEVINRNSLQPKSVIAEAATFRAAMNNPFDMVIGQGALGDIPLRLLLANPSAEEIASTEKQLRELLELSPRQESNFWKTLNESNEQQVQLSGKGEKVLAPAGSSHMFPYEHPGFVIDHVRQLI
ncbi:MAG TPA: alpha/beta hydrolase [Gammaproteobacteria bacterium]|nr:alpha/beta hydrolase [Gammaproteobacteria bacterium]HIL95947.1 alpha/beta hydrolase [Pseudomonadales bacterium]